MMKIRGKVDNQILIMCLVEIFRHLFKFFI